jgi:hypothetical protein
MRPLLAGRGSAIRLLSLTELFERRRLAAEFRAGSTAFGHHWALSDGVGRCGRTRIVPPKGMRRLLAFAGVESRGSVRADVLDAAGSAVVRLVSTADAPPTVRVTTSDGGAGEHSGVDELRLLTPDGALAARILVSDEQVWPIVDSEDARIAALHCRTVARRSTSSVKQMSDALVGMRSAADVTRYLGIANANRYEAVLDAEVAEALHALVILAPVIAAYSY